MNGNTASSPRPISIDNADEYNGRKARKSPFPWLMTTQLVVSGLQLVALVYLAVRWDSNNFSTRAEPQANASSARELDQNLIKGWHETLTLLKTSDEANARLRAQIEQLEQRLATVDAPKTVPAPAIAPVAEASGKTSEKAKE